MAEDFRLGLPEHRKETMHPDEKALRALVKGMAGIHVEVTPELIHGLSVVVEYWPRLTDTEAEA